MPTIDENTVLSEITIKDLIFMAPANAFTEGHVCNANEAAALSQTFRENLRNNFASKVADAIEKAGGVDKISETEKARLDAEFREYYTGYEFFVSGGGRRVLDPVDAAAIEIATEKVKDALRRQGKALKDYSGREIREMALQAIDKYPQITEAAKARVEAERTFAESIEL